MKMILKDVLLFQEDAYYQKMVRLWGSAMIAYFPLSESSGTVARDISANNNGTYSNVSLANKIGHNKKPVPYFDGSTSYVDIYSAGLNTKFNGNSGAILQWIQVYDLATYTDTVRRYSELLFADANNNVLIYKSESANTIVGRRIAASTSKLVTYAASSNLGWMRVCLSWSISPDELKLFVNGAQAGTTQTGNGSWTGALSSNFCIIGASSKVPANQWKGWLSDTIILNRPPTDDEVARDYAINP
jgi:hypothetical protein